MDFTIIYCGIILIVASALVLATILMLNKKDKIKYATNLGAKWLI